MTGWPRLLSLKWIRENPFDFAILIPKKVWRLWAPDGKFEWSYHKLDTSGMTNIGFSSDSFAY